MSGRPHNGRRSLGASEAATQLTLQALVEDRRARVIFARRIQVREELATALVHTFLSHGGTVLREKARPAPVIQYLPATLGRRCMLNVAVSLVGLKNSAKLRDGTGTLQSHEWPKVRHQNGGMLATRLSRRRLGGESQLTRLHILGVQVAGQMPTAFLIRCEAGGLRWRGACELVWRSFS